MESFRYIYYLTKAEGLGPVRIRKLIDFFGEPENIFSASCEELAKVDGVNRKTVESIVSLKKNIHAVEKEFSSLARRMGKLKINVITYVDEDYPELLKKIYDPPVILYTRGKVPGTGINDFFMNSLAIVGTRSPTEYGRKAAEMFASGLSSIGVTVVSGFARGIDTIAHKTVLSGNGLGRTAAVFGNGVDVVYPPENRKIYDRMLENGLVLSEFEVSSKPDSVNFPRRNRIISGLSLGVLVIESDMDGGALITARCALDQSREVFAVPGDIGSRCSRGTNNLIKNGYAKLAGDVNDVLEEVRLRINQLPFKEIESEFKKPVQRVELKGNEKIIMDFLFQNKEPVHIDEISESSGLNISDCLVNLLNLEFKGCIRQHPGKRFSVI
jgi:DNA processing protein